MDAREIAAIQDALVAEESEALRRTSPHPRTHELVHQLHAAGHCLVVVTNNGAGPVSEFIERHDLAEDIEAAIGRDPHHPELLKPAPDSIIRALVQVDAQAAASVFVGDSVTDVGAGDAAGLPVIGYANKPGKDQRPRDAGADAIITAMGDLAPARRLTS